MTDRTLARVVSLGIHALLLAAVPLAMPDHTPTPRLVRVLRIPETPPRALAPALPETTPAAAETAAKPVAERPAPVPQPGPLPIQAATGDGHREPPTLEELPAPTAVTTTAAAETGMNPTETDPAGGSPSEVLPSPPPAVAARPAIPPDSAAAEVATDALMRQIRARIEAAVTYPVAARRRSLEGSAGVRFRVASDGRPYDIELGRSSGHSLLDRAAVQAVNAGAPFPPLDGRISVPISFRLK